MDKFIRRDILLTKTQIETIEKAKIAIFGVGGVGGYTLEALVRMGVKDFIICDGDSFVDSNLNRQILSTSNTIGRNKAEVAKERALLINEDVNIQVCPFFINQYSIKDINLNGYFIVDAIDDVVNKVLLIKYAIEHGNKIISMMGAGNRIAATFEKTDIYKTTNDPLAKKMRSILKKEGIKKLNVIYSKDLPQTTESKEVGSISYVVGKAGLTLAEEVIKEILNIW